MKKWILGLTTTAAIATPVVAVVSCGDKSIAAQKATTVSNEYAGTKTAEQLAAEKAKADADAAAKAAEDARLASEKAEQDRIAANKAAEEARQEQEKLAQQKAAAAEQERLAKLAADKAAEERAKAEQERLAAEQAKADALKAEQDRIAAEQKAAADKAEQDRIAAENLARQKAAEEAKAAEAAKAQEDAGLRTLRESFANVLAPYTVDTYQAEYDQIISPILNPDNSIHAEGYTVGKTTATQKELALEKTMKSAFSTNAGIYAFGGNYRTMKSMDFNTITSFTPATDSNMAGANYHATINLNQGPYGSKGTNWSGDFFSLKTSGGSYTNVDQVQAMKYALDNLASTNSAFANALTTFKNAGFPVKTMFFSINESTGMLDLWFKGVRTLPTAASLIKSTWSDTNEDVIQLRKAIPGLQANDLISPEKYLAIIKYFFVTPSAEANHKLATASWFNWMGNYSPISDANGFNHTFKLTSPLTWSFDDYTANNLGLNAGQVVANDGQGYAYNNANFYTAETASNYETAAYAQQFDTYEGHLRAKAWIFEHMFYGLNTEDGTASAVWGGTRYHDGYNRKPVDSIDFMKDTYRLFVTTHVDPSNQDNQIIDYTVKYLPTGMLVDNLKFQPIVYRESVVNPGANPDARHMFDHVDWSQMQQVINQQAATKEITLQEFMTALIKAQAALKSFDSMASKYLADPFVGHLIDLLTKTNVDLRTLPTSVAQSIFDQMKERKDININLFVYTVNQSSDYIKGILMNDRKNSHYALSIKALQFDNVINAMLGLARTLTPESFKTGDLSHI